MSSKDVKHEGAPSQKGWERIKTSILLDPKILLQLDLSDSTSMSSLLVETLGISKDLELAELTNQVERSLKQLTHPSTNKNLPVDDILDTLREKSGLTRRNLAKKLQELQRNIYHRKLEISQHKNFDRHLLFKLHMDFMPNKFFYSGEMDRDYIEIQKGLNGDRMTAGLHNHPLDKTHQQQLFGAKEEWREFYRGLLQQVLGFVDSCTVKSVDWNFSYLWTAQGARQQDPHVDYPHNSLRSPRNCKTMLPYSLDMPLKEGGLQLNYYGIAGDLWQQPLVVQCKYKEIALWRADSVHGGGYRDLQGGGGFRLHGYLHLNARSTNSVLPQITWADLKETRYSSYLKKSGGQSFPKGNDK